MHVFSQIFLFSYQNQISKNLGIDEWYFSNVLNSKLKFIIITAINSNYHHFGDPAEFHPHNHAHNIHNQILASSANHNQRSSTTATQHHNNVVNHHMLTARANTSTATSTAAAVAAAMMLDPRFHHNTTVSWTLIRMNLPQAFILQILRNNWKLNDYMKNYTNNCFIFLAFIYHIIYIAD